ncbi:glycoside hydrolase family 18 protein [Burkholderiaceae bacterium DAT-1]|nr:glycoside hydrolase family 18 protein [Burkholderiaceae bacterium DAT-1]
MHQVFKQILASMVGLVACSHVDAAEPFKVAAYYTSWSSEARQFPVSSIPADKLTHVIFAFALVKEGQVVQMSPEHDARGANLFKQLRMLKSAHPHLKTLISIGGWTGSATFSDVAATPASRARFARSAVQFMRQYGFDGIDIDWEYPVEGGMEGNHHRPEDRDHYPLLLKAIRQQMDRVGHGANTQYLLTSATSGAHYLKHADISAAAKYVDWFNLMAYDFAGPWSKTAGHVASLAIDPLQPAYDGAAPESVQSMVSGYLAAHVPPQKLVVGVPLYGYHWTGCKSEQHGLYQACTAIGKGSWERDMGSLDLSDIELHYTSAQGFTRYEHEATGASWLFRESDGAMVTFDSVTSVQQKVAMIRAQGLGGAMMWELSGDRQHTLINVLSELRQPAVTPN